MAISVKDLFSLTHYEYGEAYYGSYRGMRFRVAREPLENVHFTPVDKRGEATLRVVIWPEPEGYYAAPEQAKVVKDFPVSEEGLQAIADYLNAYHESHLELWPQKKRANGQHGGEL